MRVFILCRLKLIDPKMMQWANFRNGHFSSGMDNSVQEWSVSRFNMK